MELQQELSKSSLKVSLNLGEDLTFIMTATDQLDIPPFMIFFLEKATEVFKVFISRDSVPSNDNTILHIIGSKVSISV